MKRLSLNKVCLFAAIFVAAAVFVARAEPMEVTIGKVAGTVEMSEDGAQWSPVANGDKAPVGAILRTKADSSCIITWAGGNAAKVAPLSRMKIEEADRSASGRERSGLLLEQGKVYAHAKKLATSDSTFELRTPTAVAGVRGTDLFGTNAGGGASFGVTDGSLSVSAGGQETMVEVGYVVNVDPTGNISPPEPIPHTKMQEVKQNTQEAKQEASREQETASKKEEKAEKKEEKEEKKEEKAEAKQEQKEEKTAAGDEKTAETTTTQETTETEPTIDQAALDEVTENATENIDEVLDEEVTTDLVDDVQSTYKTGTVDVTIQLGADDK